jgi:hypothetical protein
MLRSSLDFVHQHDRGGPRTTIAATAITRIRPRAPGGSLASSRAVFSNPEDALESNYRVGDELLRLARVRVLLQALKDCDRR